MKHLSVRCTQLAAALTLASLFPGVQAAEAPTAALEDLYLLPAPDFGKADRAVEKGRPLEYGLLIAQPVRDLSARHGRWDTNEKGQSRWTWSVSSPGAFALELQFSTLRLPPHATLTLQGEDRDDVRTFTAEDVARERFRTPMAGGDKVMLVLDLPTGERPLLAMDLESVTHVYRSPFGAGAPAKSDACHVDIACSDANGRQDQVASVVMYTFPLNGGATVSCTGTLMANTGNDATPYVLTANHCVDSEAEANDVTVYWNYQSQICRMPGSAASGTPLTPHALYSTHTQTGATLRAEYTPTDTSLLELDLPVSKYAMPFFAGWSRSAVAPTSTFTIHHPAGGGSLTGHEKRVTRDLQAPTISAYGGATGSGTNYWRVADWDSGSTQGGSSGAALFNSSGLVVGQLNGGTAACGNNDPDWFGRLSASWNGGGIPAARLSDWLDPLGANPVSRSGYYKGVPVIHQNTSNVAIADLSQTESTIAVAGLSGNGATTSRVRVRLNHTHIGDLIVELEAPDGDTYVLHNNTGGSSDNLHVQYSRDLSGSPKNGLWTLRISDTAGGDVGLLDYWAIQF